MGIQFEVWRVRGLGFRGFHGPRLWLRVLGLGVDVPYPGTLHARRILNRMSLNALP